MGKNLCGRKTRRGSLCQNPAGYRTLFPGREGYPCVYHGGGSPTAALKVSKELFPEVIDEKLSDRARDFAQDPQLVSLSREVGIARALLERVEVEGNPDLSYANMLLRTIGDLAYLHHKMSTEGKFLLRVDFVQTQVEKIVSIIFQNLPHETASFIANLIDSQLRMPKMISSREGPVGLKG